MRQKYTFKLILAAVAIILALLPFMAALSSFLTEVFNNASWYKPIQNYVVPFEAKLVSAALYPLGIETRITVGPTRFAFYMIKEKSIMPVDLSWNCLGWQSMLLFVVSLVAGLRGNFTNISRVECIIFGFFGTLLINIFRMSFIAAGIYYVNEIFATVIHDYVAALMTLIWLIFFWWFVYSFVLEERQSVVEKGVIKV